MPKFGAHMIFAEQAARARPDLFGDPNAAFRLGSIGPDMTLFLMDPLGTGIARDFLDEALKVLKELSRIQDEIERITAIFDNDLANWMTGGLSTDIANLTDTSFELVISTLKLSLATSTSTLRFKNPFKGINLDPEKFSDPKYIQDFIEVNRPDSAGFPFRYFGHPYTIDPGWLPERPVNTYAHWWWMDLLHYRLPGTFASNLLGLAMTPAQKSYANGYLTHVAGDITGHPFINRLVEGPFRNHAYRHLVIEGLVDTYLWDYCQKGDIANSRLHDHCSLGSNQIEQVCSLISRALRETYKGSLVPSFGYPTEGNLHSAYSLMIDYLKLSTSKTAKRPEPPPDSLDEVWEELQEVFKESQPGRAPNWDPSDPMSSILAILGWAWKGLVLLAMIATLPWALGARIANLPARWIVYFLRLAVYMMVSAVRMLLALMGWGYASSEDFSNFGFLKEFITIRAIDNYPYKSPLKKPPFYWLMSPRAADAETELQGTYPGSIPSGARPNWLIDRSNKLHPDAIALLTANDPKQTKELLYNMEGTAFGNPIDFAISMRSGNFPIPDLDLDGDRGYAYRTWEHRPPSERYL